MVLERGQLSQLAEATGDSVGFICDIINGKKRCPASLSVKLEDVSESVLGRKIPARDWILAGLGRGQEVLSVNP